MGDVVDNKAGSRFELVEEGGLAYAEYRREVGRLVIPYVYADPALRGTGAAGRVLERALSVARADGLKVVPICSYAAAYMRRHREHDDLLG